MPASVNIPTFFESDEIRVIETNASSMKLEVQRKQGDEEETLRIEVPRTALSPYDQTHLAASLTPGTRLIRGNAYLYAA